ncbi:MAG: AI-2E family transporter [Gammaproteobacteria bacterium]|nr:AI-2E family transporter [Gammaproteobacteria bacterium]
MMHSPTIDDLPPPEIPDDARLPVDDPPGTPPPPDPPVDEEPASGIGAVRLIAVILSLAACWLARDLLVPVMLAMMLALLGNPMVSRLARMWVPRWLGSLVVVVGGLVLAVWLSSLLISPATDWMKQAPTQLRELAPKLKKLTKQVEQANKAAASIVNATGAAAPPSAVSDAEKPRPPNLWTLISSAPRILASVLAVALLAYFFLVYGQGLQRHAIARLQGANQKQVTIEILRTIEADLSRYVLTISAINFTLGLILTGGLVWMGLDWSDALLWGTLAALFNFVPYVGPLTGVIVLGVVGVVAFDAPAQMIVPPALYLGLHVIESQFVTPIILGRRMAISPLVMLLWLMLWGFLWGIAGLLLAVPMLASLKIVAERVEGWQGWAKVIE